MYYVLLNSGKRPYPQNNFENTLFCTVYTNAHVYLNVFQIINFICQQSKTRTMPYKSRHKTYYKCMGYVKEYLRSLHKRLN